MILISVVYAPLSCAVELLLFHRSHNTDAEIRCVKFLQGIDYAVGTFQFGVW